MRAIFLIAIVAVSSASPAYQTVSLGDDGSYQFAYETGQEAAKQSQSESRGQDGVVVGKYSYVDPNGGELVVNYRTDDFGYVAKGDVSAPGAPKTQFPENEEKAEDDKTEEDDKASTEVSEEDNAKNSENEASVDDAEIDADESNEDDVKAMKLQQPAEDAPPEGFPVGFFGPNFQGLRRLPEPVNEEEEEEGSKTKTTKEEDNKKGSEHDKHHPSSTKSAIDIHHASPLAGYAPQAWSGPLSYVHNPYPVYVYSYQHPQSHGYYYFY